MWTPMCDTWFDPLSLLMLISPSTLLPLLDPMSRPLKSMSLHQAILILLREQSLRSEKLKKKVMKLRDQSKKIEIRTNQKKRLKLLSKTLLEFKSWSNSLSSTIERKRNDQSVLLNSSLRPSLNQPQQLNSPLIPLWRKEKLQHLQLKVKH